MKNKLLIGTIIFCFAGITQQVNAQLFKRLQKKAEDQVEKAIDKKINGNGKTDTSGIDGNQSETKRIQFSDAFDFAAGDSLVYQSNFNAVQPGRMSTQWITNGGGSVVSSPEISGQWLRMQTRSSFKLKRDIHYPKKFTIEFDLLVAADQVDDLSTLYFGFSKDNSVRSWISNGSIWDMGLQYMNDNDLTVSSRSTGKRLSTNFDLEPYANRSMHVSIAVNGNRVKTYLDHAKISDNNLFDGEVAKHFFISAPLNADHRASVLFGNFRIKAFRK